MIDKKIFERALKARGYSTLGELAKDIGVHRNTLHHYLSGQGVFPTSLEKAFSRLQLKPHDILIQTEEPHHLTALEPIAPLVDRLQQDYPSAAFVLFGSRARQKSQRYSDWDIGVYSEKGLPHELYRKMRRKKNEFEESSPYRIDLINLNRADTDFFKEASKGWSFLGGSLNSWLHLNKEVLS